MLRELGLLWSLGLGSGCSGRREVAADVPSSYEYSASAACRRAGPSVGGGKLVAGGTGPGLEECSHF